jgi:hypothetical protein
VALALLRLLSRAMISPAFDLKCINTHVAVSRAPIKEPGIFPGGGALLLG